MSCGEVSEWFMVTHSKCVLGKPNGGSNPPLSVESLGLICRQLNLAIPLHFHEEGQRGKGKGEREEIIGRGLKPLPIIDTPLREGLQTRIGGKKRKKVYACCESDFLTFPLFSFPLSPSQIGDCMGLLCYVMSA